MAGTKRTRGSSKKSKGGKVTKIDQSAEDELMHQLTPMNECKQSRSRPKTVEGDNNSNVITTSAQVIENEQVFEIVTQGQMSDFQSEDGQTESDSGKLGMKGVTEAILNVDHEVSFRLQTNNNAKIGEASEDEDISLQANKSMEEGECTMDSELEEGKTSLAMQPEMQAINVHEVIDKKIGDLMNRVQSYFDQKFRDLTKVMDLEKQLAKNHGQLKSLHSKGKINAIDEGNEVSQNNLVDDNQSELTIYQNVVLKKRGGSSSSEDEILKLMFIAMINVIPFPQ